MNKFGIENVSVCAKCKGKCCKSMPGIAEPSEFMAGNDRSTMATKLVEAFCSGTWAVDWWDGDIEADHELSLIYYIRPRTKGVSVLLDGSWGGEYINLTDVGCTLPFERRPYECRTLEPSENYPHCKRLPGSHGKQDLVRLWRDYQDEVRSAIVRFDRLAPAKPDAATYESLPDHINCRCAI